MVGTFRVAVDGSPVTLKSAAETFGLGLSTVAPLAVSTPDGDTVTVPAGPLMIVPKLRSAVLVMAIGVMTLAKALADADAEPAACAEAAMAVNERRTATRMRRVMKSS